MTSKQTNCPPETSPCQQLESRLSGPHKKDFGCIEPPNDCSSRLRKKQTVEISKDFPLKKRITSLPSRSPLTQHELRFLVRAEGREIDETIPAYFKQQTDYKKPCPKQTAAQETVKKMMSTALIMETLYRMEQGQFVEPDLDDITPNLAAAVMFLGEKGVDLESCMDNLQNLLPDIPTDTLIGSDNSERPERRRLSKSESYTFDFIDEADITESSCQVHPLDRQTEDNVSTRYNQVQFRGNPKFFPGYFASFPDQSIGLHVENSPSRIFEKAWIAAKPQDVDDILIVE